MKLNELQPKEGSTQSRIRVGRGIGSGKGKTSGKGVKGQKARSGVAVNGFEGGQMPLYRRLPKRGFRNIFGKNFAELSLGRLQAAIDAKRIDAKKLVDEDALVAAKIIRAKKDGVRLIGGGEIKTGVKLKIAGGATAPALAALEKAGGSIEAVEQPISGPNKGKTAKAAVAARKAEKK